jgi:hypothetical protein
MDYHALARLASNNGDGSELSGDAVQRFGELVAEQARIENREALDCLRRIVSYYDDPRVGNEWRGLPGMSEQAKCQHESTMFGEARALLLSSNVELSGPEAASSPEGRARLPGSAAGDREAP